MESPTAIRLPWSNQRAGRRNTLTSVAGICLIVAILWAYPRVAASRMHTGLPAGLSVLSVTYSGPEVGPRVAQAFTIGVSSGETHDLHPQWVELIPSAALYSHDLAFHGTIRMDPPNTAHGLPGPWVRWSHGRHLRLGSGWTVKPGGGLTLDGSVSYVGSSVGLRKAIAPTIPISGFRVRYIEQGRVHERLLRLPGIHSDG